MASTGALDRADGGADYPPAEPNAGRDVEPEAGERDQSVPFVRSARVGDLPDVAAIYTHFVLRTTSTFATSVRTPAQWRDRFARKVTNGPFTMLVAELEGAVAGYVETSQFRPQDSYDSAVETSIYVAPDQASRGVGTALYTELFERLEATDLHRAFAVVALPNDPSVAIHERFGYVHRGTLTEAGHKFGRWIDVAYFERAL